MDKKQEEEARRAKASLNKKKYESLSKVFFVIGEVFRKLKKSNRFNFMKIKKAWPKDKTFPKIAKKKVTGLDVFRTTFYKKVGLGFNPLDFYSETSFRWEYEIDPLLRKAYERKAKKINKELRYI